jgi:hypothetical protein
MSGLDFSHLKTSTSNKGLDFSHLSINTTTNVTPVKKPTSYIFNYDYVKSYIEDMTSDVYKTEFIPFLRKIDLNGNIDYDLMEFGVEVQGVVTQVLIRNVDTGDDLTEELLKEITSIVDASNNKGIMSLFKRVDIKLLLTNLNNKRDISLNQINICLSSLREYLDELKKVENRIKLYIKFGEFLNKEFANDNKDKYVELFETRLNSLKVTEGLITSRSVLLSLQFDMLVRNNYLLQDMFYNLIPSMLIGQSIEGITKLNNIIEQMKRNK